GTGDAGHDGDGGPGAQARLTTPQGLAVDSAGRVYIADTLGNRVRRVDADGTIRTVAGTGDAGYAGDGTPAIDAKLNLPTGVAYGGDGGQAIYAELNLATNPLEGMGQGLAVGPTGDVFIADGVNHRLRKLGLSGVITTVAVMHTPLGVAVDPHGAVYIADADDNRVLRID